MYNASLLKTNATNGFRVKFLDIYLECYTHEYGYPNYCDGVNIKIGTGNDTANNRSIVKTVGATTSYEDDVYVGSNEMWITVIGLRRYYDYSSSIGYVEIEVTPVSLSSRYLDFDCKEFKKIDQPEGNCNIVFLSRPDCVCQCHVFKIPYLTHKAAIKIVMS